MKTFLPQNEFTPHVPVGVDEAGASAPAPTPDAPADLSMASSAGAMETEAAVLSVRTAAASDKFSGAGAEPLSAQTPLTSGAELTGEAIGRTGGSIPPTGAIDCIPEIFRVANLLCVEAREFQPDYPGIYQAMLDPNAPRAFESDEVWLDLAPLFLQNVKA